MIGTVFSKPAAKSQKTPKGPSLDELDGPFTLVRREIFFLRPEGEVEQVKMRVIRARKWLWEELLKY